MKKIKDSKDKGDGYFFKLNICGANCLKIIKKTLEKEPLQI